MLVEYAIEAIVKYNKIRHANGGIDTLYSFLLSDSGKIHEGACYESNLALATVCGERHAKAGWTFPKLEKYTIKDFYPLPYEPKEGLWDNWQPNKSYELKYELVEGS